MLKKIYLLKRDEQKILVCDISIMQRRHLSCKICTPDKICTILKHLYTFHYINNTLHAICVSVKMISLQA